MLADDHYLVREGTGRLLASRSDVEVVASVGTSIELLEAVERFRPDAAVVDIRMPPEGGTAGIKATHIIRERTPGTGIVVLSQYSDTAYALQLFANGTAGLAYLLKDRVTDIDELLGALRAVTTGGSVIDSKIVDGLLAARSRREAGPLATLSPRELDVLREMARGRSNNAIAEALDISRSSVEKHISTIFGKLQLDPDEAAVNRRVMAVLTLLRGDRPAAIDDAVEPREREG